MFNYVSVIVLGNSLFGWLIVHFFYKNLINVLGQNEQTIKTLMFVEIRKSLNVRKLLDTTLRGIDLSEEIDPFMDERIDEIIHKAALQVPMGEYLLAGELGRKLKEKVKGEIGLALPGIQEHLIQRLSKKIDLEDILREKIEQFDVLGLTEMIKKEASNKVNRFKWLAALLGALLGFLELLLVYGV